MTQPASTFRNTLWATGIWTLAWLAMAALDGQVDLASLAMLVVLAAALASLWLAPWASAATGALAVLAFNVAFVPPRGTLHVDLRQHALLLGVLLVVNLIVAGLVSRLRHAAQEASAQAERAETLRAWGERLRDAADPQAQLGGLCDVLSATAGVPAAAIAAASVAASVAPPDSANVAPGDGGAWLQAGETDPDQVAGLKLCRSNAQAMGPGTGRYEDQPDLYLPLRGRQACLGAAVLRGFGAEHPSRFNEGGPAGPRRQLQAQLQALCDQMGLALQRARADRDELAARELAQQQGVRNSLLAAISHDYRTPLATVLGAASALDEQADRLDLVQRRRLAQRIVEETERLSRLTDNTLQLARLDGPGVTLRCDWESAEEVVGAALRHARRRDPQRRVRARLEPGLPLLWCDAMLMSQLLDNLVDNALKYSPDDAPVEILARQAGAQILLAVRDRGPGIAPAWRERVFEVFHRGAPPQEAPLAREADRIDGRPGAGVGLAVCRAIARAHGGELRLRARSHGGCAFECLLPLREPPAHPPEAGAAEFNPPEGASS
ncbi:MAG TPA: ATP-binding protein [Burkholderiaceae bacterium]|nr:ATP-binding protein [Burkholderiaceae bacterium]